MYCTKCQKHIANCECPDIKERLASLKEASNVVIKWCKKCGNHYARCKCRKPEWEIK